MHESHGEARWCRGRFRPSGAVGSLHHAPNLEEWLKWSDVLHEEVDVPLNWTTAYLRDLQNEKGLLQMEEATMSLPLSAAVIL